MKILLIAFLGFKITAGKLTIPQTLNYLIIIDSDTIGKMKVSIDTMSLEEVKMFRIETIVRSNVGNIQRVESTLFFARRDNLLPILGEKFLKTGGEETKITTFYSPNKAKLILKKGEVGRKLELAVDTTTYDWDEFFLLVKMMEIKERDTLSFKVLSSIAGMVTPVTLMSGENADSLFIMTKNDKISIVRDTMGILFYHSEKKGISYRRI